jgi:lysophospholipase L1-like esterase
MQRADRRAARSCFLILGSFLATAGCDPGGEIVERPSAARPFVRDYVAIGDGFTAGVQSGALSKRQQLDSYPNLLAQSFGVPTGTAAQFEQPLIAAPGYPDELPLTPFGRLLLREWSPLRVERERWPDPSLASPVRRAEMHDRMELSREYPRPFRNLGIPGAFAYDIAYAVDSLTTYVQTAGLRNLFVETVLRRGSFGAGDSLSALDHARLASPELATVWVGFEELHFAGSRGTGEVPYDADLFRGHVDRILSALVDSVGARVALGDVPDPLALPFYAALPWYVTNARGEMIPHPATGDPIPLLGEGFDVSDLQEDVTVVDPDVRVLLSAHRLLVQGAGSPDVVLRARIREEEGVDEDTADSLLAERFPEHGRPLPANATLTTREQRDLENAFVAYNAALEDLARARDLPLVRMSRVFRDLDAGAYSFAGVPLTGEFPAGGAFSLDGVHPTSLGNAVIADAWIEAINEAYAAGVAPVDFGVLVDPIELPGGREVP